MHSYAHPATWAWIADAKSALARAGHRLPLIGNGGVERAGDAARLLAETGCDAVMVGRAALADPWIFRVALGGAAAGRGDAVAFALRYIDALAAEYGDGTALARGKQLVRWYRAGDLFADAEELRQRLLRVPDLAGLRAGIRACDPSPA